MSRPTPEQIRAAGERAMKDMRAKFGPCVNADVIDIAEQRRRNALLALDVLVRAYVPKNTNDWREGLAAIEVLRGTAGVQECFPMLDPNVPEFGSRYPEKGCYRVGCAVHGGPPCTVCGKRATEHGTYPTCATHPYSPDGRCGHVGTFADGRFTGVPCAGAECKNGCVRSRDVQTSEGGQR